MNGHEFRTAAVVEALQRLSDALADMREELPGQVAQAAAPGVSAHGIDAVLEPIERQLRWLADDMARMRGHLAAKERGHDSTI